MTRTRHFSLLLSTILFVSTQCFSQDPVFSQFYAAPLQLNPAFAGTTLAPRIALNYRNQWPYFNKAYVTYAASYDQLFEAANSGVGLFIQTDNAGDGVYTTTNYAAAYSYQLTIREGLYTKIGVEAGGAQIRLDWNRLLFGDQIDRINGPNGPGGVPNPTNEDTPENLSKNYFDISAGLLIYSSKFYLGFSAKHLNTPDESILGLNSQLYSGLPMRLSLHGGTQITITKGGKNQWPVFVSPNLIFVKQGDFAQVNTGAYFGFGMFFAGGWYRHTFSNPDAIIAMVGVQKDIFKIGYSFDITLSQLGNYTNGGAHELSLILNFENSATFQSRKKNSKYNDCFQLFR